MTVRVTCRACGKRLKLPDGISPRRSAKCPKCLSPVDLTAATEASVYLSAATAPPRSPSAEKDTVKAPPPLPDPGRGTIAPTKPAAPPRPPGTIAPPLPARKEPPNQEPLTLDEEAPLSLDDDPTADTPPPTDPPPFRVPVTVLADSARQILGPCFAVFVPHGLFLEVESLKPFFYVPVGCPADSPGPADLTVALTDGRAVTLRVRARYGRALARDAVAFLGGERPAPAAAEYRRRWWLLAVALVLAAGLVSGPLTLARTANLDAEFATKLAGAFALAGFGFNAAVVLFSRRSTFGQLVAMALACALVTGVFLFGAGAYLAGRERGREEARAEFPPPAAPEGPRGPAAEVPPAAPGRPAEPGTPRPPTHLDKAAADGVSALEDGPAEVTALDLAANGNHLAIGHADGSTRVWALEQPTFDVMLPGPKLDGPVTRVQFDGSCRLMFAYSSTGVVAVPRGGVPPAPVRLSGAPVAVAPELSNERLRFAAVRGNAVAQRLLGLNFVLNPPAKAKGFAVPAPKDEVTPAGVTVDPPKPAGPTFLAWSHGNRLFAGSPDGAVTVWSAAMKADPTNRDHKAPVRAWASSAATWDFATGDDKGAVAVWPHKGTKPVLAPVFGGPVGALSFAPSGQWLAAVDATGWLAICEANSLKVLTRKKLPFAAKALAFGPTDDVLILGNGKTVEVWSLPALLK